MKYIYFFSGRSIFSQSLSNINLNPSNNQASGAKVVATVDASVAATLDFTTIWSVNNVSLTLMYLIEYKELQKIDLKLRLCAGTNSVIFWLRVQKLNSGFLFLLRHFGHLSHNCIKTCYNNIH